MPWTLERPERKGDRARRKISTPSERVEPIFEAGKVRVVCERASTRSVLIRRHGFVEVSSAAPPAPIPVEVEVEEESQEDPSLLSYRERVALAKRLGVEGAHRMRSEALLEAILAAQS